MKKYKNVKKASRFYPKNKKNVCKCDKKMLTSNPHYVAAKATYICLLYGQKGGFSALAP